MKRHQAFAGIPAFYSDAGLLVTNGRGEAASDSDVDAETETELDRIALEMCAYDRAIGKQLEPWQLEAEANALRRQWQARKRGAA